MTSSGIGRPFYGVRPALKSKKSNSGPFVSAWLRLSQAHLNCFEAEMLRWHSDVGKSAEMRRVYSGL